MSLTAEKVTLTVTGPQDNCGIRMEQHPRDRSLACQFASRKVVRALLVLEAVVPVPERWTRRWIR
jgi:hypothetical protein